MKTRNTIYVLCMAILALLALVCFDRGFNVKTKNIVKYQEKSDISYRVNLINNNIYKKNYLGMGERYISKYVNNIDINFNYTSLYNNYINGYYEYKTKGIVRIYDNDKKEMLFDNEYLVKDNKVVTLNQGSINEIKIFDNVIVDYNYYNNIYNEIVNNNKDNITGNLEIDFIMSFNFDFSNISNVITSEKEISMIIPLGVDSFRITMNNNYDGIDEIADYEERGSVNYFLLIVGAVFLSLAVAFLGLVIRAFVMIYERKTQYEMALSKILSEYDDIIVKVSRFYNKKKYNLIYLDSFDELLDVYKKVGSPISYREIRRGYEAIFLLIDDDNAWIYRMVFK